MPSGTEKSGWPCSLTAALSIRARFALDRGPQHEAILAGGKVGAGVHRASIVPDQQVMGTPNVLIDPLRPFLEVEDLL